MTYRLHPLLAEMSSILAALAFALVLRVLVFEPFTVPSASMEPNLLVGDYLIASKSTFGWSRYSLPFAPNFLHGRLLERVPERGDIVVFRLPRDPGVTYVKRVIGLPGDEVQLVGGRVLVNGRLLPTSDLGPAEDPDAPGLEVIQRREHASAARDYVTFDRGSGRPGDDTPIYRVPAHAYLVLGDNRDNSIDSRWPRGAGVGFVPAENLVGKAVLVLASWRPGASTLKPWTWATHLRSDRLLRPL